MNKQYEGEAILTIDEFEIEYAYNVDYEPCVLYFNDMSGLPESVAVECTITGMGGMMVAEDWHFRHISLPAGKSRYSMVEFWDHNQDKIYRGKESLRDMIEAHCLESLDI